MRRRASRSALVPVALLALLLAAAVGGLLFLAAGSTETLGAFQEPPASSIATPTPTATATPATDVSPPHADMSKVEDKEVVLAIFGASIALTGLILLLLGMMAPAYQANPTWNLLGVSTLAFLAYMVGILSVIDSLAWLVGWTLFSDTFVEPFLVFGFLLMMLMATGARVFFELFQLPHSNEKANPPGSSATSP